MRRLCKTILTLAACLITFSLTLAGGYAAFWVDPQHGIPMLLILLLCGWVIFGGGVDKPGQG